jgi:hypothetical protein
VGGVYASIYRRIDAGRVAELPELLPTLSYFVMAPFLGPDGPGGAAARASEPVRAVIASAPPCLTGIAGPARDRHETDAPSTPVSHKPLDPTTTPE